MLFSACRRRYKHVMKLAGRSLWASIPGHDTTTRTRWRRSRTCQIPRVVGIEPRPRRSEGQNRGTPEVGASRECVCTYTHVYPGGHGMLMYSKLHGLTYMHTHTHIDTQSSTYSQSSWRSQLAEASIVFKNYMFLLLLFLTPSLPRSLTSLLHSLTPLHSTPLRSSRSHSHSHSHSLTPLIH